MSNPFTENSEKAMYFNIFQGKITQSCKPDTPNAIQRENKDKKVVHELHFDAIAGHIIRIDLKEPPEDNKRLGKQWVVSFRAPSGELAKLTMKYDSGYAMGLLKRLPNIDFNKTVKFKPSYFIPEGGTTERAFMSVFCNNVKVDPYFTKDNHNGLPQLEKKEIKGEVVWDNYEQMQFFEKLVAETNNKIKQLLPDGSIGNSDKQDKSSFTPDNEIPTDDDLPF